MNHKVYSTAMETIPPVPRGGDLTKEDLRQIVQDLKEQLFRALEVRLGRRPQIRPNAPTAKGGKK